MSMKTIIKMNVINEMKYNNVPPLHLLCSKDFVNATRMKMKMSMIYEMKYDMKYENLQIFPGVPDWQRTDLEMIINIPC